jgi:hypothetical protein
MVPCGYWTKSKISTVAKTWNSKTAAPAKQTEEELRLAKILPAKYKPINITDIVEQQTHLTADKRKKLLTALLDFQDLFQRKCGKFNGDPISLELIPGSTPFYGKPFSIPKAYQQITKNEIARLESLGVLTKVPSAEWAPMPKIPDIFRGLEKFRYPTMIDLNMGYYSMPLSEESKKLCVISLLWGLFQYEVLPQGIKPATDGFQQCMGALFTDMPVLIMYTDDSIVFGYLDFNLHLSDVVEVLRRLKEAGMQVNPSKCLWFQTSVTYLGFPIKSRAFST